MAHVRIDGDGVTVELSWWERPFAGSRSRLVVPCGSVVRAECVERPTAPAATPGGRAGLVIAGVLKIGRWGIGTGRHRFVSVRRGLPALRLVLDDRASGELGYHELLISTPDARRLAGAVPA